MKKFNEFDLYEAYDVIYNHPNTGKKMKLGSVKKQKDGTWSGSVDHPEWGHVSDTHGHKSKSVAKSHVNRDYWNFHIWGEETIHEDGMGGGALGSGGPTNVVGSGAIAGSGGKGGEPGVNMKKKTSPVMGRFKRKAPL